MKKQLEFGEYRQFFSKIEKWSFPYIAARHWADAALNRLFYKRVVHANIEEVPDKDPCILIGNHQNTLLDPLVVLGSKKWVLVFLARADIFKGLTVAKILRFFKILPIFRMRDGRDFLEKNKIIFEKAEDILSKDGSKLCMFPEGSHLQKYTVRDFHKGVAFMAIEAQQKYPDKRISLVPFGLNYGHYSNIRSSVLVKFGKPIYVDTLNLQGNDKERALELITIAEQKVRDLVIDIPDDEFYELKNNCRELFSSAFSIPVIQAPTCLERKWNKDKKLVGVLNAWVDAAPDQARLLDGKINTYKQNIAQLKIRAWIVRKQPSWLSFILRSLLATILFPLGALGTVICFWPYRLPLRFTPKLKDQSFAPSIHFALGLLLFTLWFGILWGVSFALVLHWWEALFVLPALIVLGLVAHYYHISLLKLAGIFRFLRKQNSDLVKKTTKLHAEIKNELSGIYSKFTL